MKSLSEFSFEIIETQLPLKRRLRSGSQYLTANRIVIKHYDQAAIQIYIIHISSNDIRTTEDHEMQQEQRYNASFAKQKIFGGAAISARWLSRPIQFRSSLP